jgi:hypothetical protein
MGFKPNSLQNKKKITSLIFKLLAVGSKLILLSWLASLGHDSLVAEFGVYLAFIVLASSSATMELYSVTIRRLLRVAPELQPDIVGRHFGNLIVTLSVICPIFLIVFLNLFENLYLISSLFFIHLLIEAYNQDIMRLLIAKGYAHLAMLLNFTRSGLWVFVAIPINYTCGILTFESLVMTWLTFSFVALLFSLKYVARIYGVKLCDIKLNLTDLRGSIKLVLPIFLGSIFVRCLIGGDRLLAKVVLDSQSLAVYVLYASIVFFSYTIIENLVSAWRYPEIIKILDGNVKNFYSRRFKKVFKSFYIEAIGLGITIQSLLFFAIYIVSKIYYPDYYSDNLSSYLIMSLGVFCFSLSIPIHYTLHGIYKDKLNTLAAAIASVLFFLCYVLLYFKASVTIENVSLAMFLAFFILLIMKFSILLLAVRNNYE